MPGGRGRRRALSAEASGRGKAPAVVAAARASAALGAVDQPVGVEVVKVKAVGKARVVAVFNETPAQLHDPVIPATS